MQGFYSRMLVEASIRRQDDIASLLLDWFGQVGPPAEDGIRLDLHVSADENLVSRSPFVRLEGSADLNITGTDARPGLVGSVEFMEGGEFTLQGTGTFSPITPTTVGVLPQTYHGGSFCCQ